MPTLLRIFGYFLIYSSAYNPVYFGINPIYY